jgi:hypothetical protein
MLKKILRLVNRKEKFYDRMDYEFIKKINGR